MKLASMIDLYERLPDDQRLIVDVLRSTVRLCLPEVGERLAWNVPFFYGNKGICIIWPAAIPRGGIKSGVLLGFWYGNQLADENSFLAKGTNSQLYYHIYSSVDDIDESPINNLLLQAWDLDRRGAVTSLGKKTGAARAAIRNK